MSARVSRLVFDAPAPEVEEYLDSFGDCATTVPQVAAPSFLGGLRYRLLSDERLAKCLQDGEHESLTVLFERHSPRLFAIARRVLRNDAEAEDAVQQIFLDVFRSIQQFDPDKGDFQTWLRMFAYHRSFNRRRHLTATGYFSTSTLEEDCLHGGQGAASATAYPSVVAGVLVKQALKQIQPRQRRTIELVYYHGMTAEEVAAKTGETVRVVRHNLYRGLEAVRRLLFKRSCSAQKRGGRS